MSGIMVVFGTRPEAIKLLPVVSALRARSVPTRVCVTAQHRDLLDKMLAPEPVQPDIDLDLMRAGESLPSQAGRMLATLGEVFDRERPTRVVVQGDTATAFAAAHAAYLSNIRIAHVEAGLRTGNLASPHPEEGNRRMIAALADLHFAPTALAAQALLSEGVKQDRIHITGNTVVDALRAAQAHLATHGPAASMRPLIEAARGKRLLLITCHRRENVQHLDEIIRAARQLGQRDDIYLAWVLHPNPAVRCRVEAALRGEPSIALVDPLAFLPFVTLLSHAHLVLTDSGGVQEEAPVLGTPVLVLRDSTERREGLEARTSLLVGTSADTIVANASRLLDSPLAHSRMARVHSPYGDGQAAERIAELIALAEGYGFPAARSLAQ